MNIDREQLREYAEQLIGPNPKPFTAEQQQLLIEVFGPHLRALAEQRRRKKGSKRRQ